MNILSLYEMLPTDEQIYPSCILIAFYAISRIAYGGLAITVIKVIMLQKDPVYHDFGFGK